MSRTRPRRCPTALPTPPASRPPVPRPQPRQAQRASLMPGSMKVGPLASRPSQPRAPRACPILWATAPARSAPRPSQQRAQRASRAPGPPKADRAPTSPDGGSQARALVGPSPTRSPSWRTLTLSQNRPLPLARRSHLRSRTTPPTMPTQKEPPTMPPQKEPPTTPPRKEPPPTQYCRARHEGAQHCDGSRPSPKRLRGPT